MNEHTSFADLIKELSEKKRGRKPGIKLTAARAGLPQINLDDIPISAAKQLARLIAERRDIFLNGYTPVRVVLEDGQEPRAIELTVQALRTYAHKICACVKGEGNDQVEVPLTKEIAELYLDGMEGEWGLRPLRGISSSPLLGNDGSIRVVNGYDEVSGMWCTGVSVDGVPDEPTEQDAKNALLRLRQAFSTFAYGDAEMVPSVAPGVRVVNLGAPPGLDESTQLATLMTAVCRGSLDLAPAVLYNAPDTSGAGTGKGLLFRATCVVGCGIAPQAMSAGHSPEEMDKRLVAAAITASPAIYLDNFNGGMIESDTLASFLTENPAQVRVLGQSKLVPLNSRMLVGITGNAVQISEDHARRVNNIDLDAQMENPEARTFPGNYLGRITDRRNKYLAACLTIWRWGIQQPKLPRGRPIGNFERWARWCRDPLIALRCRDPMDRIPSIKAADPRRRQITEAFSKWWEHHQDRPITVTDLHSDVKEVVDTTSKRGHDGELTFSRQKVQKWVSDRLKSRVSGYHLVDAGTTTSSGKNTVIQYRLLRAVENG